MNARMTFSRLVARIKSAKAKAVTKKIDGKTYTMFGGYKKMDQAIPWEKRLILAGYCARTDFNVIYVPKTNRVKSEYRVWFRKC